MVATRRIRNGPISRLLSPVNEGLGLVTRTGSRVLNTGNSVWRSVGNGVRGIFSNVTQSVNSAGRRLIKGKRGGSMRTRKNRNRKEPMRKRNRSNRNRSNRNRSDRNRSNRNRKNRD